MPIRTPFPAAAIRLLAGLVLVAQGGCMSALTSASLREAILDSVDALAEVSAGSPTDVERDADVSAHIATDDPGSETALVIPESPKLMSLDEAVDRAVARLQGNELDSATQATLLAILESTSPEDWPAAIDAFTASLESRRPMHRHEAPAEPIKAPALVDTSEPRAADAASPSVAVTAAPAEDAPPRPVATRPEPSRLIVVETARPAVSEPATPEAASLESSAAVVGSALAAEEQLPDEEATEPANPPLAPQAPLLAVRNACFVSRVRAWGVVDRFAEAAFRPGQDVIVYFELDAPASHESAGGHGTNIDTLFRLVTPDGRQIGQWNFEPLRETSHAPRRDYFARYILRIPQNAPPGPCRLDFVVTDLVAGISTQAHLDLEVR